MIEIINLNDSDSETIPRKGSLANYQIAEYKSHLNSPQNSSASETENLVNFKTAFTKPKSIINKADILLGMINIVKTEEKHNENSKTSALRFWEGVADSSKYKSILQVHKPETLKKYWCLLMRSLSTFSLKEVSKFIVYHKKSINKSNLKILNIIHILNDFFANKIVNIREELLKNNKKTVCSCHKNSDENSSQEDDWSIEKREKMLCLGNSANLPNFNNNANQKVEEEEDNSEKEYLNFLKLKASIAKQNISEVDLPKFQFIEKVIAKFGCIFPGLSEKEICESLKKNSFNIKETYLYLRNPLNYETKCFDELDDNVLSNLNFKDKYFHKLVKVKGMKRVKERQRFLELIN